MSSETKFTPGPWRISRYAATYIEAAGERGICSAGGYSNSSMDSGVVLAENQANAHLIAAAPDLYSALESILYEDSDKPERQKLYDRVRAVAVLAKARGE